MYLNLQATPPDLPNESSGTKQTDHGDIVTVILDIAIFNHKIVDIIQRDCGDFKIFERYVMDTNLVVFISMNAYK